VLEEVPATTVDMEEEDERKPKKPKEPEDGRAYHSSATLSAQLEPRTLSPVVHL